MPLSQRVMEGIELAGVYDLDDQDEILDHKHLCLKTKLIKKKDTGGPLVDVSKLP